MPPALAGLFNAAGLHVPDDAQSRPLGKRFLHLQRLAFGVHRDAVPACQGAERFGVLGDDGDILDAFGAELGDHFFRVVLSHRALAAGHGHDAVVHDQQGLARVFEAVMGFQVIDGVPQEADVEPGGMEEGAVAAALVGVHAETEGGGPHPQQPLARHGADHDRPVAGHRIDDRHGRAADADAHEMLGGQLDLHRVAVEVAGFQDSGFHRPPQRVVAGNLEGGAVLAAGTVNRRPPHLEGIRHPADPLAFFQELFEAAVFELLFEHQPLRQDARYEVRIEVGLLAEQGPARFVEFAQDPRAARIIE